MMSESEFEFIYIGWCKGIKKGVESDKVWTAFKAGNAYYAGWGARGKAIRFKKHESRNELEKVMRRKQKEYNEVDEFQLFTIFPYFKDDVAKKLSFDILTNNVL
jgi:hypothetical protein